MSLQHTFGCMTEEQTVEALKLAIQHLTAEKVREVLLEELSVEELEELQDALELTPFEARS